MKIIVIVLLIMLVLLFFLGIIITKDLQKEINTTKEVLLQAYLEITELRHLIEQNNKNAHKRMEKIADYLGENGL